MTISRVDSCYGIIFMTSLCKNKKCCYVIIVIVSWVGTKKKPVACVKQHVILLKNCFNENPGV